MKLEESICRAVSNAVFALYDVKLESDKIQLQQTKKEFDGGITVAVFPFVKLARKSPEETGRAIGEWRVANQTEVAAFNVIKGFLNLSIHLSFWVEALNEVEKDADYGILPIEKDAPLFMIEYSSPNTNKPLHLGHIRNNLLGFSISEIQKANGNRVVKTNIVNDRGIHICKSMLAWKLFGNGETPEDSGKKGDHLVGDYYVRFDKEYKKQIAELITAGQTEEDAKKNAPLMQKAQRMLLAWEQNDPTIRQLWKQMNGWVYAGFDETRS